MNLMEQPQTYLSLVTCMAEPLQHFLLSFLLSFGQGCSRMNTHFFFLCFLSSIHGKGGAWMRLFFFHHSSLSLFNYHAHYFIVSTHDAPTQHVYDMSCPSHLVYHACHGRPLLIRGGIWHASPPFLFHALIGPYASTYHISKMSHISPID